jgi:hypothetical protein
MVSNKGTDRAAADTPLSAMADPNFNMLLSESGIPDKSPDDLYEDPAKAPALYGT